MMTSQDKHTKKNKKYWLFEVTSLSPLFFCAVAKVDWRKKGSKSNRWYYICQHVWNLSVLMWCILNRCSLLAASLWSQTISRSSDFLSEGRFPPRRQENESSCSPGGQSLLAWRQLQPGWVQIALFVLIEAEALFTAIWRHVTCCFYYVMSQCAVQAVQLLRDKSMYRTQSTSQFITVPTFVVPLNTASMRAGQIYWISIPASVPLTQAKSLQKHNRCSAEKEIYAHFKQS